MVSVSRAKGTAHFPARFILIATMNPCPCGNYGIEGKRCTCTQQTILKYQKKISGPIIDRIDMWVEVSKIDHEAIVKKKTKTNEREGIKELIHKTRAIQRGRFQKEMLNGDMNAKSLHSFSQLSEEGEKILTQAAKNLDLSARACHRIIKLARTIADIDNKEKVEKNHILEALQYRPKKES